MGDFDLGAGDGAYLVFFGRIHPDKGTAEAMDVAESVGIPLLIAGIIHDRDYFARSAEPRLDGIYLRYVGAVDRERRAAVLGGARALLHLIDFDEPFGFSVVEAMACGTPVIARRRGSMSEIVEHGENGFLVDSVDEAVAAVHASTTLNRRAVRASVERRFDAERTVDDYVALYRRIVRTAD